MIESTRIIFLMGSKMIYSCTYGRKSQSDHLTLGSKMSYS